MSDITKKEIDSFDQAFSECRKVFIERRKKYGNYMETGIDYHLAGLKLKCCRFSKIKDLSQIPDKDTILDMVNYGLMILSLEPETSEVK